MIIKISKYALKYLYFLCKYHSFYAAITAIVIVMATFGVHMKHAVLYNEKSALEFADYDDEITIDSEVDTDEEDDVPSKYIFSTIKHSQNLSDVLKSLNVHRDSIAKILQSVNIVMNSGNTIKFTNETITEYRDPSFANDRHPQYFISITQYEPEYLSLKIGHKRIILEKSGDGFKKIERQATEKTEPKLIKGTINDSLYESMQKYGISGNMISKFIHLYSFDVDFQRDIRSGDDFIIIYNIFKDDENFETHPGDILYANLNLKKSKQNLEYYVLEQGMKNPIYYNAKGIAARKSFMKTPINGARMSSKFGMRRHPILGYSRLHAGIDFAASKGTPVYAAASGIISFFGWNGGQHVGYGRYIVIRHNGTYSTAYAHLSKFKNGIGYGSKVSQGQTIGYVGSTGYSTGAHLHYEVIKNGKKVDPKSVTSLNTEKLGGKDLEKFNRTKRYIDGILKK